MNVLSFTPANRDELELLTTRHLLGIFKRTRGPYYTCGCPYHCGDDVLTPEERQANKAVRRLNRMVKEILDARPHLPTGVESRTSHARRNGKPEKKVMKF